MDSKDPRFDLRLALSGDEAALERLVAALTPVIQTRVARCLLRWRTGPAAGRSVRQEVEDLTQDVFLHLFADRGRVLRTWEPGRGLSLVNFVGLVAERQAVSILRSWRSPWKDDPTLPEDLDAPAGGAGPEQATASREELGLLWQRLTEELSPLGRHLFELLFLQELTLKEVVERTGLSRAAVYAWRSRLRRLARRLRAELSESGCDREDPRMDTCV
jgi:RNA polymerase sigma-70 factor (ECF subfamily)